MYTRESGSELSVFALYSRASPKVCVTAEKLGPREASGKADLSPKSIWLVEC